MNALRSFLRRLPEERKTVLKTIALAPAIKVMLRARGYSATTVWLARLSRPRALQPPEIEARAQLAHRVVNRLPLRFTCLERALVVWWLSGRDPSVEIRFGVQPVDGRGTPRFHAWVEMDGEFLDDGSEDPSAYLPLAPAEGSSQLRRFD